MVEEECQMAVAVVEAVVNGVTTTIFTAAVEEADCREKTEAAPPSLDPHRDPPEPSSMWILKTISPYKKVP